jgi:hypothetical protein
MSLWICVKLMNQLIPRTSQAFTVTEEHNRFQSKVIRRVKMSELRLKLGRKRALRSAVPDHGDRTSSQPARKVYFVDRGHRWPRAKLVRRH